jgi:hypothetical protein
MNCLPVAYKDKARIFIQVCTEANGRVDRRHVAPFRNEKIKGMNNEKVLDASIRLFTTFIRVLFAKKVSIPVRMNRSFESPSR